MGKDAVKAAYTIFIAKFNKLEGNEGERAAALVASGLIEQCAYDYEKLLAAIFSDAVRARAAANKQLGVPKLPFSVVSNIFCR